METAVASFWPVEVAVQTRIEKSRQSACRQQPDILLKHSSCLMFSTDRMRGRNSDAPACKVQGNRRRSHAPMRGSERHAESAAQPPT